SPRPAGLPHPSRPPGPPYTSNGNTYIASTRMISSVVPGSAQRRHPSMRARVALVCSLLLAALALACGSDSNNASSVRVATPAPAITAAAPSVTSAPPTPSATPALRGDLTVFAASSLTDAFGEIGPAFTQANPGVTVKFSFGASTALRTQLEQGAKADVFAS